MATAVENVAYRVSRYATLGDQWGTLWSKREKVVKSVLIDDLPLVAKELGFEKSAVVPKKRGKWEIYERIGHTVPNFPDGGTVINSRLGFYYPEAQEEPKHVNPFLRIATDDLPEEEFLRDLNNFTGHYIERPAILGFPSRVTTGKKSFFGSWVAIMAAGTTLGYLLSSGSGDERFYLAGVGMMIGGVVVLPLTSFLAERRAQKSIPAFNQYIVGDRVEDALKGEGYHTTRTLAQRDLYNRLGGKKSLDPNVFLDNIYYEIPGVLIEKRINEMGQIRYPSLYPDKVVTDTVPQILEVAHILQRAA